MSRVWPIGIIVGLGAVVVANAVMITIALTHPSAPATTDHWAESLDWDRELAVREASAALGWSMTALVEGDDGTLQVEIVDDRGVAIDGLRGTISLARADTAEQDRTLALHGLGAGRYQTQGPLPVRGLYRATVDVQVEGGSRYVARRQLLVGQERAP